MEEFSINFTDVIGNLLRVVIAFALAVPIGWERGYGPKSVGIRTFPIVSMASCGFILIAKSLGEESIQAGAVQGLIGGIGFIGGGAILKQNGNIQGIVTAASIWNTGAMGIAVAYSRLDIGIILSLMNFLSLYLLTPVVKKTNQLFEEQEEE